MSTTKLFANNIYAYTGAQRKGLEAVALCAYCTCEVTEDTACSRCGSFHCEDCDSTTGSLCEECGSKWF